MAAKRRYRIKHSNDFLVLAGIMFFLGIWAIRDAWYPSEKTLKKHPLETVVTFDADGSVDQIHVKEGDLLVEGQLLINLRKDRLMVEFDEATNVYAQAKSTYTANNLEARRAEKDGADEDAVAELIQRADEAKALMSEELQRVGQLRVALEAMDVISPGKGKVKKIYVSVYQPVKKGDRALAIDPQDHFYLFNKSLAVFCGFALTLFLGLHFLGR